MSISISELQHVRKLKIIRELLKLEKYSELKYDYNHLLSPFDYSISGENVVYNIEVLAKLIEEKNYGQSLEAIDKIISVINSRIFKVKCDLKWDDLIETSQNDVKFCSKCTRHIFEVKNENDLNKRKKLGQCVFFNPNLTNDSLDGICNVVVDDWEETMGLPLTLPKENDSQLPFTKNN